MKIFSDDEFEEIKPLSESDDKGTVITPENKGGRPNKELERPDIIKGIIADDVIELGKEAAALIHSVSPATASRYSRGEGINDPDVKAEVIANKHGIESVALAKLMDTLDLLDPSAIEKEVDKVKVIAGLATVIDKVSGGNKGGGNTNVVHLELHMPKQKSESDYETIRVSR